MFWGRKQALYITDVLESAGVSRVRELQGILTCWGAGSAGGSRARNKGWLQVLTVLFLGTLLSVAVPPPWRRVHHGTLVPVSVPPPWRRTDASFTSHEALALCAAPAEGQADPLRKGGTASPNVNRGLLCSDAVSRRGMGPSSSAHSSGSRGWRAAKPGCFGNISLRRQLSLGKQNENIQRDHCC